MENKYFFKKNYGFYFSDDKKTSTLLLNNQIEGVIFILVLPLNGPKLL